MLRSSSSRRINWSCGTFLSSASQDHDRRIDRGQHGAHVVDEFDGARAISIKV